MPELVDRLQSLYARPEGDHILPFVGRAFREPQRDDFRILAVGLNSYVSAKDWPPKPEWFKGWFETSAHRFYPGVKREATVLGSELVEPSMRFRGLRLEWPGSFLATNAIKKYLPESTGKRADQLSTAVLNSGLAQWHLELDLLSQHGVFPHLIAIFGERFWSRACGLFAPLMEHENFRVVEYHRADGACLHHANRLRLGFKSGEQDSLLVRLRHPSARTKLGSAQWLLEQPDFRRLALLS